MELTPLWERHGPGDARIRVFAGVGTGHVRGPDVLDAGERARAARYVRRGDRIAFVERRTAVRQVLGEVLGMSPESVPLHTDAVGRPSLDGWSVSLSGCGAVAAVALARGVRCGIDVEAVFDTRRARAIAPLLVADEDECGRDARALTRLWTAKEAYAKTAQVPLLDALRRARAVDGVRALVAGGTRYAVHELPLSGRFPGQPELCGAVVCTSTAPTL
ncbi:4'-phosphopantetheinyl transferase superfamily protein [Streptomyces sp. N35]|uniref:4'-phosphopantetheinyl transferase family protein n=1 Tax=Streptomyces sp. N35 TaxID=2795730 RepID=UPI0018F622D7|nr:4'-phosphopantetheinyl transferase superfamily protein [Streptomyces sp. N35]